MRLPLLLCALTLTPAALPTVQAAAYAPAAVDPWPAAPVLTRLFTLPSGQADGTRLIHDLHLDAAQRETLRRLAASEAAYGQAGRRVIGREEAARLNRKISLMNAEKDRKVRLALGGQYPVFREWVRQWWKTQVDAAH